MNLGLTNKVFIVTGGAKGIGGAISETLAAEGAIVVVAGRNEADNLLMVEAIRAKGGQAEAVHGELSVMENCRNVIDFTTSRFGQIDGIVNNAGVNDGVGLENGSPERFMASFQLNVSHFYNLVHFGLPWLKKTKGNVINIGSKVAETGQGNTSGYAASKGAINALTREWAVELLPYQIRVNAVIPAETWTPQYASWIKTLPNSEEVLNKIVSKIPLGKRMTTSEEIADMTVFLLSDRSAHTTGQIIYVDGGYTHLDRAIS